MSSALLVDSDASNTALVGDALADVGCLDLETATLDEARALLESGEAAFDLIVLRMSPRERGSVRALRTAAREVPILVVCDEADVDLAFLSGATECITLPLRAREMTARIRAALRSRTESRRRAQRERNMSDTIVALQREKEDLERLACVDALTGVANRRHALQLLDSEWRRSARDQLSLGLVMIDLDCFHQYNEQYGHLGGDTCLQQVADAMVRSLRRPSDFLGRYGGEEFIAVLPNTDAVGAKIVAERLRTAVESLGIPHIASSCSRVVTITAGFAAFKILADWPVDKVIAAADGALLRAKARGRNRIDGDAPLVRSARISAQRWQRYAPVYADPWYADRIPAFLDAAHDQARALLDDLQRGILPASWSVAAEATAGELGLVQLDSLIADLQRALAASDELGARAAVDEVIQYVTHVQVVYRRSLQQTG